MQLLIILALHNIRALLRVSDSHPGSLSLHFVSRKGSHIFIAPPLNRYKRGECVTAAATRAKRRRPSGFDADGLQAPTLVIVSYRDSAGAKHRGELKTEPEALPEAVIEVQL